MNSYKSLPLFLLFLEEMLLWQPNNINTLLEKVMRLFFSENELYVITTYANPAIAIYLFLMSFKPITEAITKNLYLNTNPNLLKIFHRFQVIRLVIAVCILLWVLLQILMILDNTNTVWLDLYQNKTFWSVIFSGIFFYALISPKGNSYDI